MALANISVSFNFPPLQSSTSSTFTILISLRHLFYWFFFGNEWLRLLYLIQWLIYASHLLNIMVYQQRIEIQGETLIRCKKTEEVPQFLKFNATSSFRVISFSLSLSCSYKILKHWFHLRAYESLCEEQKDGRVSGIRLHAH